MNPTLLEVTRLSGLGSLDPLDQELVLQHGGIYRRIPFSAIDIYLRTDCSDVSTFASSAFSECAF